MHAKLLILYAGFVIKISIFGTLDKQIGAAKNSQRYHESADIIILSFELTIWIERK